MLKVALLGLTTLSGLAASARAEPALKILGHADAASSVAFEVMLPLRNKDQLETLLTALHDPASPSFHKWLTPAQFGLRFGPDSTTISQLAQSLRGRGFTVNLHTRSLHVTGSVASTEQLLGNSLVLAQTGQGHVRVVAQGVVRPAAELTAVHATIVGLSGIEARTMSRSLGKPLQQGDNRFGNNGAYYYTDLKQAYVYPSVLSTTTTPAGDTVKLDGTGATIGVVISSDVLDSDIAIIFDHENYSVTTGQPDPTLFARVPVNGGSPFNSDSDASFEASLDVQQELTGAPGAHVVLYNIPDLSDDSIMAGYTQVVDDNTVDLVSSSFGGEELQYFPSRNGGTDFRSVLEAYHEIFLQGNAQGITFMASSGDSAGKQATTISYYPGLMSGKFIAGINSPASDPNVTAVGGTNLVTVFNPPSLDSTYAGENAWSDPEVPYDPYGVGANASGGVWGAGGGTSRYFKAPSYQSKVTTTYTQRAVPDIGMMVGGCPGGIAVLDASGSCNGGDSALNGFGNTNRSAAVVAFAGLRYGVIGTSVSSPEFAGAVAMLIQHKGRQGNLNEYIYGQAAAQAAGGKQVFHTNIPGYNGLISSNLSSSYNISTGVGTPIVKEFVRAFEAAPAGLPQTTSNP